MAAEVPSGVQLVEIAVGPIDAARLSIRPMRSEDTATIAYLANDTRVSQYLRDRFAYPYTMEHAKAYYEMQRAAHAAGDMQDNLYTIAVDDVAVGGVGLHLGSAEVRHIGELGYWLGSRYWGHGIAPLAAKMLLEKMWAAIPQLVRVEARVLAVNEGSLAVVKKCGFVLEAVLKHANLKRGKLYDVHIYVLFREHISPALLH